MNHIMHFYLIYNIIVIITHTVNAALFRICLVMLYRCMCQISCTVYILCSAPIPSTLFQQDIMNYVLEEFYLGLQVGKAFCWGPVLDRVMSQYDQFNEKPSSLSHTLRCAPWLKEIVSWWHAVCTDKRKPCRSETAFNSPEVLCEHVEDRELTHKNFERYD